MGEANFYYFTCLKFYHHLGDPFPSPLDLIMAQSLRNLTRRGSSLLSSLTNAANNTCSKTIFASQRLTCNALLPKRHFGMTSYLRQQDYIDASTAADVYLSSNEAKIRQLSNEALEESLCHDDYFGLKGLVNMQELFDAGVHFGHKQGMGFEAMTEYMLGHRFDTCIIDLNHTVPLLEDALNFIAHIAFRGGIVLFITNHRETAHLVEATAMECGEYAHTKEWLTRVLCDSTNYFGAVTRLPDLVILLSTKTTVFDDHLAVRDTAKMLIPTVAICDSNSDPRLVTYPIPGNDDSVSAVSLYLRLFKTAILRGKTKRASVLVKEENEALEIFSTTGSGVLPEEETTKREKNEELIRQITALQEATKKSNERVQLELEAVAREAEFEKEEKDESEKLTKKIQQKKKMAKKKKKRTE